MGQTAISKSTEIEPVLKYNNQIAEATEHALNSGAHGLKALPGLLRIMLDPKKECWKARYVHRLGDILRCESFKDYIADRPPKGLGTDSDTLKRLCPGEENTDVRDMIDAAMQGKHGVYPGNQYSNLGDVDNIHNSNIKANRPSGTSEAAALRRLRKSAPKLHEKVIAGEMSAHAAMVKAGFRPKTITVPVDVEKAARVLVKNFKGDALILIEAIKKLLK